MKYVMNVDLVCSDGNLRLTGQEVPGRLVSDYMRKNGVVKEVEEPVQEVVEEPVQEVVEEPVQELLIDTSDDVKVEVEVKKSFSKRKKK